MIKEPPVAPAAESPTPVRISRGSRRTIIAIVLVAVLVIGIIGYAAAGFIYAAARISSADSTLNTVISHQNQLNNTFRSIDTQSSTLKAGGSFNIAQAQALINQFVASSEAAGKTIDRDDASLASASNGLKGQRWLTGFSQGSLDRESARIAHARKALADARIVAADYVQDGQFWSALYAVLADLDKLSAQNSAADMTGARATLTGMKGHVDSALQLSTAPGLPPEMHSLMLDFQALVGDFGKLLDAAAASDDNGIANSEQLVQNDLTKIGSYDFDKIGSEINAYYKPLVDGFNSEMAAATA